MPNHYVVNILSLHLAQLFYYLSIFKMRNLEKYIWNQILVSEKPTPNAMFQPKVLKSKLTSTKLKEEVENDRILHISKQTSTCRRVDGLKI